ncbi:hypothetical protein CEXT_710111 [Caerostris extrusa]|uniref:Uncharacterized protein n=1 Tax=Caerostris extrusa TaxID=172846 RepID=A0AAV4VTG6_CAEEX|nr:hypothetical protein CEXT_710111 [Caerostris extrusa]
MLKIFGGLGLVFLSMLIQKSLQLQAGDERYRVKNDLNVGILLVSGFNGRKISFDLLVVEEGWKLNKRVWMIQRIDYQSEESPNLIKSVLRESAKSSNAINQLA